MCFSLNPIIFSPQGTSLFTDALPAFLFMYFVTVSLDDTD